MEKTYYELHEDYRMVDGATVDDYVKEYEKIGAWIDTKVIAVFEDLKKAKEELAKYTCDNPNWYFLSERIVEVKDGEEIDTNQGDLFYEFAKEA